MDGDAVGGRITDAFFLGMNAAATGMKVRGGRWRGDAAAAVILGISGSEGAN